MGAKTVMEWPGSRIARRDRSWTPGRLLYARGSEAFCDDSKRVVRRECPVIYEGDRGFEDC